MEKQNNGYQEFNKQVHRSERYISKRLSEQQTNFRIKLCVAGRRGVGKSTIAKVLAWLECTVEEITLESNSDNSLNFSDTFLFIYIIDCTTSVARIDQENLWQLLRNAGKHSKVAFALTKLDKIRKEAHKQHLQTIFETLKSFLPHNYLPYEHYSKCPNFLPILNFNPTSIEKLIKYAEKEVNFAYAMQILKYQIQIQKEADERQYKQLEELTLEIPSISNLQSIELPESNLSYLPEWIGKLSLLEEINVQKNEIKSLPSSIQQLHRLRNVNISSCKLGELPNWMWKMTNLEELHADNCGLSSLPNGIGALTNLTSLSVGENKIKEVPEHIYSLQKLKNLNLSANLIEKLPLSLGALTSLKTLKLDENPKLSFPPISITGRGTSAIVQYLNDFSKGTEEWKRVKIITIGHEKVGKSTVIEAIKVAISRENDAWWKQAYYFMFSSNVEAKESTVGIDMSTAKVIDGVETVIWDFAGQPEYTTTHQLFLGSANTIYVLVVDSMNSEEKIQQSIAFWMKFITAFSPKDSKFNTFSVLLVGNKYDSLSWENQRKISDLISQYEKQGTVSHSCIVSAKNLTFVTNLRRNLQLQAQELFQSNNEFFQVPMMYKELAKRLSTEKKLLTKAPTEYSDSCFSFLQDMGIILFNRRTKMICLNPQILAKAIACFVMPPEHEKLVYNKIAPQIKNLSIITGELLKERLKKAGISSEYTIDQIIECLQEFDFCYRLDEKEALTWKVSEGYIFPFLRPFNASFKLQRSSDNASEVRTMGVLLEESHGNAIGSSFFFKLQVIARKLHKTSEIPLFANGMRLYLDGNTASIWQKEQDSIQIVIQGPRPSSLWKEIQEFIEQTQYNYRGMKLSIYLLCPRCIVDMIERSYKDSNQPQFSELPKEVLGAKFSQKDVEDEAHVVNCGSHSVDKSALTEGFYQKISTPKYAVKHMHVVAEGNIQVKKAENINVKNLHN